MSKLSQIAVGWDALLKPVQNINMWTQTQNTITTLAWRFVRLFGSHSIWGLAGSHADAIESRPHCLCRLVMYASA